MHLTWSPVVTSACDSWKSIIEPANINLYRFLWLLFTMMISVSKHSYANCRFLAISFDLNIEMDGFCWMALGRLQRCQPRRARLRERIAADWETWQSIPAVSNWLFFFSADFTIINALRWVESHCRPRLTLWRLCASFCWSTQPTPTYFCLYLLKYNIIQYN